MFNLGYEFEPGYLVRWLTGQVASWGRPGPHDEDHPCEFPAFTRLEPDVAAGQPLWGPEIQPPSGSAEVQKVIAIQPPNNRSDVPTCVHHLGMVGYPTW